MVELEIEETVTPSSGRDRTSTLTAVVAARTDLFLLGLLSFVVAVFFVSVLEDHLYMNCSHI